MPRLLLRAASGALCLFVATQAYAQPMVATFKGVLTDTSDPFTATFYYDTKDLVASLDNDYVESTGTGTQWASYVDPLHNLTFSSAGMFSKGEYTSVVSNDDGSTDTNTVHQYTIRSSTGLLDLTFGGTDDSGLVTFSADGVDSSNLSPDFFSVTKSAALATSPVPLPTPVLLFGSALTLLGLLGFAHRSVNATA